VYVFSSYYKWGGGIDLGKSFEKFKKTLNEGADEVQSQIKDNEILNMAIESVGDAWEDLTSNEQLGIIKGFREGYGKGQLMAKGGEIDPSYTHFAVRKSDGKIVTGWEYNDVDKQSIKYYTTIDLKDMDFKPSEFRILTSRYLKAKGIDPFDVKNWWNPSYDLGGSVEEGNLLMLKNKAREFEHHAKELQEVVEKNPRVDAWVVAKAERASSDLSDITHYLEGQVEMDDEPSSFDKGGTIPKVFEKVTITIRDVDMGGDVIYKNDHWINKKALDEKSSNDIGLYIMRKYGIDYGNTYKFNLKRSGETKEKYNDGGTIKSDSQLKQIIPNIDTSKKKLDEISASEKKEVASKIDELVTMVNEAKEKGEKPKYFNLCDISIPGTNIYCDDNLGIDRNDMPQFKGNARPNSLADQLPKDPKSNEVDTEEFFKLMLNKRGIEVNGGNNDRGIEVEPDVLKATQMNMVGDKVAGMYGALEKDPTNRALTAPIYVSNDGYVLDGHHRWAAIVTYNAKNPNNPIPMKVRIIDLPIKPLVRLANDFANSIGIEKKAAVAGQMAKGGELSLANKIRLREINEQIKEEQKTIDEFDEDDVQREYDRFGNPSPLSFNQQVVIAAENNLEKLQEERKILLESKNMPKGLQVTLGDYEFDEHGWAYSYGKFKAKNRSFGFMVSVDPNEKASVSWDEPYMQNATWDKKIIDEVRKDMPITNEMAKGGETKSEDSQKKSVGGFIAGAIAGSLGTYLYQKNKNKSTTSERNKSDWREDLKSDIDKEGFDYAMTQLVDEDEINDEFKKLRNNYLSALKKVKNLDGLKKEDKDELESYYDSEGIDDTLVEKGVWRGIKNTKFQSNRKEYIKSRDAIKKYLGLDKNYAKGGEINTRTFYVNTNLDSEFQDLASNVGVDFEQVGLTSRSFVYEVQGTESQISKLDDEWLKTRDDYEKYERKRKKNKMYGGEMAKGGETKFVNLKTLKGQSEVEKYLQKGWSVKYQGDKFAILQKGGKKMVKGGATFDDTVKAISKNLKGRKVPKKLQKDYGKTYDTKQERDDAARRIAGAMRAEEMGTRKK
jgi:hypothetical protein